jgi:hypothetical protein
VKKKSGKYRMVDAAMKINKVTVRNANLPPSLDKFSEEFARMHMTSLIDSSQDTINLIVVAGTYQRYDTAGLAAANDFAPRCNQLRCSICAHCGEDSRFWMISV